MSRPLVYLVAVSRHPMLMDDPTARDVLVCMADLAQDRNGGRIVASVGSLAEACQRGSSAVRHARDRLIAAGFVVETGVGEVSKRAAEYRISEETLHAVCTKITPAPSPRKQREIAASLLPSDCPDLALGLPSDCPRIALGLPSTRARLEQEPEQEPEQEEKRADARSESAPILGHEVEALNAATALRNQAALGKRGRGVPTRRPAPVEAARVEATPLAPTPEPEPRKASPGEARVAAAVETLLAEIGTDGQPERTLKLWRAKLHSRISDDGVSEDAVGKRVEAIRAAWANLQRSAWHVANGCATRGHFIGKTLRSGAELDAMAAKRADGPRQWAPKQARPWAAVGGAQLQPPMPDPVADAEHAERMAALERVEREHLEELERQAAAESRARDAAKLKLAPPPAPPKAPTEVGRGAFARMGETLTLNGLAIGQRAR